MLNLIAAMQRRGHYLKMAVAIYGCRRWKRCVGPTLVLLLLSGCWGVGLPGGVPERFESEAQLLSFNGKSKRELLSKLGHPHRTITDGHREYLVYQATAGGLGVLFLLYVPIMVAPVDDLALHCARFDIDESQHVVGTRYEVLGPEVPSGGYSGTCEDVLWKPGEYSAVLARKKENRRIELVAAANEGHADAAVSLSPEYSDHEALRRLAVQGNVKAAMELARITGDGSALALMAATNKDVALARMLADATGDTSVLEQFASTGNAEASYTLARRTGDLSHLTQLADSGDQKASMLLMRFHEEEVIAPAIRNADVGQLRRLAEERWPQAMFALAQRLDDQNPEKLTWLCSAVEKGHGEAIATISTFYGLGRGDFPRNTIDGYVWMRVAERNEFVAKDHGVYSFRSGGRKTWAGYQSASALARRLNDAELEEAEDRLAAWSSAKCPAPVK